MIDLEGNLHDVAYERDDLIDNVNECFEILRYTEFNDINSNPIYENFIIKTIYGLRNECFTGIVKMIDGCWCVDYSYLPENKRPMPWNRLSGFKPEIGNSMEIIGNIFENKELLTN